LWTFWKEIMDRLESVRIIKAEGYRISSEYEIWLGLSHLLQFQMNTSKCLFSAIKPR
jgi:hypothetical protein